jgi:glycosyltransferase involved in cell wall biosynthesis
VVGTVSKTWGPPAPAGVLMHGPQTDLAAFYARADVCINPVRHGSGLKIKTIEALAHGKALVSTSHGSRGLEAHAGAAYLVANDPGDFAQAVLNLVQQPALAEGLRQAALAVVEQEFNETTCLSPLLALLSNPR